MDKEYGAVSYGEETGFEELEALEQAIEETCGKDTVERIKQRKEAILRG